MREQHRRNYTANVEKNLSGKKNARQVDTEPELLRTEAAEQVALDLWREDFGQNGSDSQGHRHYRDDDGKSFLRLFLFLLRQKASVDGDESDRGGATRHDVVQKVGDGKPGDIGVRLGASAERPGDVSFADIADDPREHHGSDHQERRGKRAVLM